MHRALPTSLALAVGLSGCGVIQIRHAHATFWRVGEECPVDDAEVLEADEPAARYVDEVGQLVAVAADVSAGRSGNSYRFLVLESDEVNAYGSSDGAVMVTTGLLEQLQSEDELAAVLAHEIAHIQRGHGAAAPKPSLRQPWVSAQVVAEGIAVRIEGNLNALFRAGLAQKKANRRDAQPTGDPELEADRLALRAMVAAGYAPEAFTGMLQRLDAGSERYGRTHPRTSDRISALEREISGIDPARREALSQPPQRRIDRFEDALGAR